MGFFQPKAALPKERLENGKAEVLSRNRKGKLQIARWQGKSRIAGAGRAGKNDAEQGGDIGRTHRDDWSLLDVSAEI